jgi:YHS domain-containing protein
MRKLQIITVMFLFAMLVAGTAFAEDKKAEVKATKKIELKEQTLCPVMGGKINTKVYTDIQGQRVYHCCPGCSAPLKKDPDKYFQKAAAEGVLFENIQTTCPVSGAELKKKEVALDFEGRRVYFCCEGCVSAFKKDPQKYLTMIDEPADKTKKKDMKMDHGSEDHSKHNH